ISAVHGGRGHARPAHVAGRSDAPGADHRAEHGRHVLPGLHLRRGGVLVAVVPRPGLPARGARLGPDGLGQPGDDLHQCVARRRSRGGDRAARRLDQPDRRIPPAQARPGEETTMNPTISTGRQTGLATDSLSVWLEQGRARRPIAESISLRVAPGESIAIVGESGSGKSVTARALLGLLPPELTSEGDVSVAGTSFLRLSEAARRRLRGNEIAFIMQDPFTMLNPVMKVGDQVTAALRGEDGRKLSKAERRAEAVARLNEVGITDPAVAGKYPFQLSGGMRQRVGIAASIAENPRVLFADEPTTALDVTTQQEVLKLLDRLRKTHELGLILITHALRVAFATCDRVYVTYAGQIVEVGETDAIRT